MVSKEVETTVKPYGLAYLYGRLAKIEEAIDAILAGAQEYLIGSRRIKRADLGILYAMQKETIAAINALETQGDFLDNTHVAYFPDTR